MPASGERRGPTITHGKSRRRTEPIDYLSLAAVAAPLSPSETVDDDCLVLGTGDIEAVLNADSMRDAIEVALGESAEADSDARFRQYLPVDDGGFHIVGGSARFGGRSLVGLKVNARFDSGRMRGMMFLVDAVSGHPLCLLDSSRLTAMRTAAMVAIAARHLARQDATRLLVVGSGRVAGPIVEAICATIPIAHVDIWSRDTANADSLATTLAPSLTASVYGVSSIAEAAGQADLIVTATPAPAPLLRNADVGAGTVVISVGSDAPGKHELDPRLLGDSTIVVDSLSQCLGQGELGSAVAAGAVDAAAVRGELAGIVSGGIPGRRAGDDRERFVVDLTGIALQDVIAAALIHRDARAARLGSSIRLDSR